MSLCRSMESLCLLLCCLSPWDLDGLYLAYFSVYLLLETLSERVWLGPDLLSLLSPKPLSLPATCACHPACEWPLFSSVSSQRAESHDFHSLRGPAFGLDPEQISEDCVKDHLTSFVLYSGPRSSSVEVPRFCFS